MSLPPPSRVYDPALQARVHVELNRRDSENHKKGRDVEIGPAELILTAPNGTRYAVRVDNTGALTTTAL